MIRAKLSDDGKWLMTSADFDYEYNQMCLSFTKKYPNWRNIQKRSPNANVEECFMNDYGWIPAGLWVELIKMCQRYRFNLQFLDNFNYKIKDHSINQEQFNSYVTKLFEKSDMMPMPYQLGGVFNMLQFNHSCVEISTGGGKTLVAYILFKYMTTFLNVKHVLYITPKTELTKQSAKKFLLYDNKNGIESDWTYSIMCSDVKKKEIYNDTIVFGNYQTLRNMGADFFQKYDAVIIDEAHHTVAKSIMGIINKCPGAKYMYGLSGTLGDEDSYNSYVIQSFIGPIVFRVTSFELINKERFATPVYVTQLRLKYLTEDQTTNIQAMIKNKNEEDADAGGKILELEENLARESLTRKKYICDMIIKAKNNSLVVYSDIKYGYGMSLYKYIKENSSKNVFYIDGSTKAKTRDIYKEAMEDDKEGNTVIIASMGCFTEGIDIANLWNIFLVESTKSDNIMAQLLGRGMRRYPGKDKTMMIDIVDDFRAGRKGDKTNYLMSHGRERENIYKKRGFPCTVYDVDLRTDIPLT